MPITGDAKKEYMRDYMWRKRHQSDQEKAEREELKGGSQ